MALPIDPVDTGPVERQEFFRGLFRFHKQRGSEITKMPVLGGREVDLYDLYERVCKCSGAK